MLVLNYFPIASEFQAWLLWYSPLILFGVLPNLYYSHYCQLVTAIVILLSDTITEQALGIAERLLVNFCGRVSDLYGNDVQHFKESELLL